MDLLDKINPNLRQDKLIYLGDYIDRGPQSYKVIRFLIDLQNKYGKEHVVLLRGNHEDMAIENIEHGSIDCFNGYDITFMDFIKNNDSIENYYEFFKGLKMIYYKFIEILEKEGLKVINPVGEEFDPHICEAAVTEASDDVDDHHVISVLRKGYMLNDFVIRPAVVKVCVK